MKIIVSNKMRIEIVDPGRGKWTLVKDLAFGYELRGFDGENYLYLFFTGWQSGDYYATVVHCRVDNTTITRSALLRPGGLEVGLNDLIVQADIED